MSRRPCHPSCECTCHVAAHEHDHYGQPCPGKELRTHIMGKLVARRRAHERDRGLCRYCGIDVYERKPDSGVGVPRKKLRTIDHVLPRSRGGRTTLENLVTACQPCNARKGSRTPEEAGMDLLEPGTMIVSLLE